MPNQVSPKPNQQPLQPHVQSERLSNQQALLRPVYAIDRTEPWGYRVGKEKVSTH